MHEYICTCYADNKYDYCGVTLLRIFNICNIIKDNQDYNLQYIYVYLLKEPACSY